MDVVDQGVTTESPTVTDPAADPSQATTQPAQQNGGPQSQYVPYERFQQVNGRMREYERAVQTLQKQVQELTAARQAAGQPQPSAEEQAAREALYRLDPNLKNVSDLSQKFGQIEGVVTTLLQNNFFAQGDSMIGRFAETHGLEAKALAQAFYEAVKDDPHAMQRVERGDVRLVGQFLKGLEPIVSALKTQNTQSQRDQQVQVAQTKLNLRSQPPRPGSSTSGNPAPVQFDPGKDNPRNFWEGVQKRARDAIRSAAEG